MPLVLDRQIRDAAPRIEPVGRRKRRGRTGIQAGAGRSRNGRPLGSIGRELEREEDLAEKQPRAELPRNEIGVLALPAEAGAPGDRLFHHRRGIDKQLERARPALLDPMREPFQAPLQSVVIIAAARINRERTAIARFRQRQRVVLRGVINAEHDHRARFRPQRPWIAAPRRSAAEPAHVAVIAAVDEFAEPGARLGVETRFGKSDRIEFRRQAPDRGSPRGSDLKKSSCPGLAHGI